MNKNSKSNLFAVVKRQAVISVLVFLWALLLFAYILFDNNPFPFRPLGFIVHHGFSSVVPVLVIGFFAVYKVPGRLNRALNLIFVLALFALTLRGLWESGATEPAIVNGLLPWQDAAKYHADAQRLAAGFLYGEKTAMRPFFSGFLALLLVISGQNLQASLALLVLTVSLSVFLLLEETRRSLSPLARVLLVVLLFLFYRDICGSTLTENLGLALGVLGLGLLVQAAGNRRLLSALSGIFMVSMALNTRPGPFFVLPFLVFWIVWLFKEQQKGWVKPFFLAVLAGILPFVLNQILILTLSDKLSIPFANFAYAIYGMVTNGGRYTQIFIDHPEVATLTGNQHYIQVFRYAWAAFLAEPGNFLESTLYSYRLFFSNSWYSMFGYVLSDVVFITTLARFVLYGLSLLGVVAYIRKPKDALYRLAVYAFIGVLLSVPFVPPGDAHKVRLYAAVLPLMILLPAIGVHTLCLMLKWNFLRNHAEPEPFKNNWSLIYSLVLVLVVFYGPLVIHVVTRSVMVSELQCPTESDNVLINYERGSYLKIHRESDFFLDRMPDFHYGQYALSVHGLATQAEIEFFEMIDPPAVILHAVDLRNGAELWFASNPDILPKDDGVIAVCGQYEDKAYAFFYGDNLASSEE